MANAQNPRGRVVKNRPACCWTVVLSCFPHFSIVFTTRMLMSYWDRWRWRSDYPRECLPAYSRQSYLFPGLWRSLVSRATHLSFPLPPHPPYGNLARPEIELLCCALATTLPQLKNAVDTDLSADTCTNPQTSSSFFVISPSFMGSPSESYP